MIVQHSRAIEVNCESGLRQSTLWYSRLSGATLLSRPLDSLNAS